MPDGAAATGRDFVEFYTPLTVTVAGKEYRVPPCPAALGLRIVRLQGGKPDPGFEDRDMGDLYQELLGGMWDEMMADGAPFDALMRAGLAALCDVTLGRIAALAAWESGVSDPEALAAKMAAMSETSTASETGAPSPASTKPTTGLPTTRPGRRPASKSPGRKSSTSGRS